LGFASRGITSADILSAITSDSTQFAGADIDQAISTTQDTILDLIRDRDVVFAWVYCNTGLTTGFKARNGTWDESAAADFYLGSHMRNSSAGQNNSVSIGAFMVKEATTYTAYIIHQTANSHGKIHLLLNDVDKGSSDAYSVGVEYNQISTISIGSLSVGLHCVTLKISDKNAGSDGYNSATGAVFIVKT
jgi:hypothetical protein